uniref:NUMOD4 motif protein n=1 Tax=Desulfovibrio sp. U5L TaxID=596152 RepID=I2Q068_9BACT
MHEETWRTISSFPEYAVSNKGRVKRIKVSSVNNRPAEHVLRPSTDQCGYKQVCLVNGCTRKSLKIHRLVAEAFISAPPSPTHQCNHIDGIKSHNDVENLEWMTPSENMRHAVRLGLKPGVKGQRNNLSKLKDGEVWLIKKLLNSCMLPVPQIAAMFMLNKRTIFRIKAGSIWSHVPYGESHNGNA